MKQTTVEWLIEQIKIKADNVPTNTKENRMVKGVYVDCLIMARQAKEIEKEQLHKVWKAAEQNMRSQFSSSNYKNLTFDEYYETKT